MGARRGCQRSLEREGADIGLTLSSKHTRITASVLALLLLELLELSLSDVKTLEQLGALLLLAR